MFLTSAQAASLADRQRVWQVRRFCQVRLAHVLSGQDEDHESLHVETGDAALSALLRCLVYELDADLAAISLLDEQTQYFLSVVQKSALHDSTVRRADWFGCDRIPMKGGICERTITQEPATEQYPVYEILDLVADETTTSLPVVNGTFASFKSYVGVPLTSPDGLNVGALFMFKNRPQTHRLTSTKRRYLCQTAHHTMRQLIQTVGALESKRSLVCNSTASSFVDNHALNETLDTARSFKTTTPTNQPTLPAHYIYEMAANLLSSVFEFEGVMIQELPRYKVSQNIQMSQRMNLLAQQCSGSNHKSGPIEDSTAEKLLQTFPRGAVLQLLSVDKGGVYVATTQGGSGPGTIIKLNLHGQYPGVEQFMFMPLWDSFHDRDSAFILGWTSRFTRVYYSATDLPSLSSFGAAIMTQVRRSEAQVLSRKKADFVGSISHEMRSPLHGFLSSVSLLRDTGYSAEQLDLLENAESCGLQLQSNIDKILLYSGIGSPSSTLSRSSQLSILEFQRMAASTIGSRSPSQEENSVLTFIEGTIDRAVRQSKSTQPSTGLERCSMRPSNHGSTHPAITTSYRVMTIVDATPMTDFPLVCCSDVKIIISNLLVSVQPL
jgi:signal transduction histidine kinase